MAKVAVKFDSREWDDFIRHIDDRLKEPTRMLRAVMNTWGFKDIVEHFRNEEGPEGPWQPRSPKTDAAYDRRGGMYRSSNKILQLSGDLRKSTLQSDADVQDRGKYSIAVYSNSEYGARHDQGTGGMPKREFMWISDSATERMAETILNLITETDNVGL